MATNYGSIDFGTDPTPETAVPTASKKQIGRPLGSSGRRTIAARELADRLRADPLEFLLRTMKNRRLKYEIRLDAAKAATPFLYPKLSTVFVNAKTETNVNVRQIQMLALSDPELAAAMEKLSLALSDAQRAALQSPAQDEPRVIDITPHPAP